MAKQQLVTNPRIGKLIELEIAGRIKPEHQQELDAYRARGAAPKSTFKPMSEPAATKLQEQVDAYAGLDRAVTGFKDDFSGPGSGIENTAQGWLGTGTPGQRDWWADFKASDNQVRNALFGASLTPSEQASYAGTSITPNMTASEIRANLERRRTLAREVLGRRAAFARANGYEPGAVSAILGDYDPAKVASAPPPPPGDQGAADPFRPQEHSFSVENVADFAAGLNGGKYELTENGATYNGKPIDLSDDVVNSDAYGEAYRRKFGRYPLLQVSVEGQSTKPTGVDNGDGATGAFLRGAGDTATFGTLDELGGVVDTIAGEGGDGSFSERLGRNITRNRGVMAYDADAHSWARTAGQLAGGVAIPIGAGARTAGELARVGALSGGAYGAGSADGGLADRGVGALRGAVAGSIGGYTVGRAAPVVGGVLSRFQQGPSASRVEASALAQAAERQNVQVNAADLRPGARNVTAFLEASPGGAGPVQRSITAGNEGLEAAVGRIGGGTAQTPEAIGSMVQDAGRRAITWSHGEKDRLYANAERLAGGTSVRSDNAVQALDTHIAELGQTPNANRGILNLLNDMRGDLVDENGVVRDLSVDAIRRLRTAMRGEIGTRNLTMTDAERRVGDVIDAASNDITGALQAANPRAADAYRRADAFYRQRQTYVRDVIQNYLGPRDQPLSGERAYARIMALAGPGGDRRKLVQTMQGLSVDERADVASTVAAQLGRRVPEDDFSPGRFVTQAEKMTPGARLAVFGQEGADAVDDLIRIAAAKRDTANRLNNSRSGQVSNYDRALGGALGLLGAGGGYAAGGVGGAAAGAVAASAIKAGALNLSARLLTNPGFVRWLGRAPAAATPAQVTMHIRQLGNVATRNPVLRGEVEQLQRALSQSTTSRSLASEREGGDEQRTDRNQAAAAGR